MLNRIKTSFHKLFANPVLKKKLFFTALIVFAFRVLASIPVSVADIDKIQTIFEGSDFLSLLNI
ncbi:MAG TPA: hypothetical protein PLM16_02520, partial [Candidatus Woesebacteria bacterium]|nr:hypothetical protein [Candidatus Woesebacteria bacterium]